MESVSSVKSLDVPTPHSQFYFSDGNIVLSVQNMSFKLHKSIICQDPQSAFSVHSTISAEPMELESWVTASEFENFVRVIYCMQFATKLEPGILPKKHWLTVLRLASKFNFPLVLEFILASTNVKDIQPNDLADYLAVASSADVPLSHKIFAVLRARAGRLDGREIGVLGPALAAAVARGREEYLVPATLLSNNGEPRWEPPESWMENLLEPLPTAYPKKAPAGPITHHPKYYFPDGNLVVLVENILFNLHRSFLCRDPSSAFASMLNIPTGTTQAVKGSTDDTPMVLPEVSARAFADLVTAIYNSVFNTILDPKALSISRWPSILLLTDKFRLTSVTKIITSSVKVTPLFTPPRSFSDSSTTATPISNAANPGHLAHVLAIMVCRPRVFPARTRDEVFHDLCCRNSYLTQEEVTSLGSELTALVFECREKLLSTAQRPPQSPLIDTYQIAKTYSDRIVIT